MRAAGIPPEFIEHVTRAVIGADGREHAFRLARVAYRSTVDAMCRHCDVALGSVDLVRAESISAAVAELERMMNDHANPAISWRADDHEVVA